MYREEKSGKYGIAEAKGNECFKKVWRWNQYLAGCFLDIGEI